MALPAHNMFLRGLYLLLIIGMFIFMSIVIRGYWAQSPDSLDATQGISETDAYYQYQVDGLEQQIEKAEKSVKSAVGLANRPSVNVAAKHFLLDLNQSVDGQMAAFWRALFEDDILFNSDAIRNNRIVFQIYDNYDHTSNTVSVFLGFEIIKVLKSVNHHYIQLPEQAMLPRKSVLYSWQNAEQLPFALVYELDYEVFQLDKDFNTISQKAFLNIKRGAGYE